MSNWKYFSVEELKCKGTGECKMDEQFMEKLVRLREDFNRPMVISSGYRSPDYNAQIGGAEHSAHVYGRAVDVVVGGELAYDLVRLASLHGFTGIGVSQKGPYARRFIHIDDMPESEKHRRPTIWSY